MIMRRTVRFSTPTTTAYPGIARLADVETVKQGISEFVNGMASTNGIVVRVDPYKTRLPSGPIHQMSQKHLNRNRR